MGNAPPVIGVVTRSAVPDQSNPILVGLFLSAECKKLSTLQDVATEEARSRNYGRGGKCASVVTRNARSAGR